jgi:hypothetical protein
VQVPEPDDVLDPLVDPAQAKGGTKVDITVLAPCKATGAHVMFP